MPSTSGSSRGHGLGGDSTGWLASAQRGLCGRQGAGQTDASGSEVPASAERVGYRSQGYAWCERRGTPLHHNAIEDLAEWPESEIAE